MRASLVRDLMTTELRRRMSYRGDFWISAVSSLAVRFGISWFIVKAVFAGSGGAAVAGYDERAMFLYYVAVILVGRLVQSTELEQSISQDIYEGGLTRYLLYPAPYGAVKFVQQVGGLGPAGVQILLFGAWIPFVVGLPREIGLAGVAMGLLAIVLANLLNFLITFPIQLVAFWADNVWSLMVMHRFISGLLGGMMVPLALFPESARLVLEALPFRYLFAFPVEAMLGRLSFADWGVGMAVGAAWCVVLGILGKSVWKRGTLQYTGVGI